jgi:CrcB protein
MNYLAIFIGGGLGSLLRYSTNILANKYFGKMLVIKLNSFPIGTFLANVFASILLGLIIGYFNTKQIENIALRNLLIIGFCGGFSTFSTFAFENYNFIKLQNFQMFVAYSFISIIASLAAIVLGLFISKNIFNI